MDEFLQAYNQMLNNTNDNSIYNTMTSLNLIEHLIEIIKDHLQYFVNQEQYRKYVQFLKFRYSNLDQDKGFEDIKNEIKETYTIKCIDDITLRFLITDTNTNEIFEYSIIPQNLIKYIDQQYDFVINGGTISNPIKDDNYFIFKSILKPNKEFINIRKQNIKDLEAQEKEKNNQFIPREETINDVFYQYMGYFRNK